MGGMSTIITLNMISSMRNTPNNLDPQPLCLDKAVVTTDPNMLMTFILLVFLTSMVIFKLIEYINNRKNKTYFINIFMSYISIITIMFFKFIMYNIFKFGFYLFLYDVLIYVNTYIFILNLKKR